MSTITNCREPSCRARIVYLPTKTGAQMPVDAQTVSAGDRIYDARLHTSHFKTCKKPNQFGKGSRK